MASSFTICKPTCGGIVTSSERPFSSLGPEPARVARHQNHKEERLNSVVLKNSKKNLRNVSCPAKGFGRIETGPTPELWLPPQTRREKQRERELKEAEEEGEAQFLDGIYSDFGVKTEDQLGYKASEEEEICPCGGRGENISYAECCRPFHKGQAYPSDALSLMRSRYSAYVKKLPAYLVDTTHRDNPDRQGGKLEKETEAICKFVTFEKLEIVNIENRGDEGFVTFEASMKGKRGIIGGALRETSRCVKEEGVWKYRQAVNLEFL